MSFSARQQHCLEAMGIVPWVPKFEETPVAHAEVPAVPAVPIETAENNLIQPAVQSAPVIALPDSLEDVKNILPLQPVRTMLGRAGPQSFNGVEDAPLLVIVEGDANDASLEPLRSPFNAESSQLFELMMRAIVMPIAKRKHCVLIAQGNEAQTLGGGAVAGSVSEQLHVQTRAVLLLVKQWSSLESLPVEQHHTRLDQSSLPLWRIPHPDLLIERTELKRQAWLSLQALQSAL